MTGLFVAAAIPALASDNVGFAIVRSAKAATVATCIPHAVGRVAINPLGRVEVMHIEANGLPPSTEFDVFVIQQPNAPFGMSWYMGDMESNARGTAFGDFIGRFSIETFFVAPGSVSAPVVHPDGPFPDADTGPATDPVHTYHVGLWFGSPAAARAAGCPGDVTPFNGTHNAGIQAMSTRNFPNLNGPLRLVH